MKSSLSPPVSADLMAELVLASGWLLLLFRPALGDPRSLTLVLAMGITLLFLKPLDDRGASLLGPLGLAAFLWVFASAVWSLNPGVSLQSAALAATGPVVFFTVRGLGERSRNRLYLLLLAVGFLSALLGISQWLWGFDWIAGHLPAFHPGDYEALRGAADIKRAYGLMPTPGTQASFLILLIPSLLGRIGDLKGRARLMHLAVFLVLAAGLLAAQSAGAWVALAAALGVGSILTGNRWGRFACGLAGVLSLILILERGWHHWSHAALGNRLELWGRALDMGASRWVLGAGAGCFDEAYFRSGYPLLSGAKFAHNLPLQSWVELGLPGVMMVAAALFSLFKRVGKGWATPVGMGVLAVAFHSLLDLPFVMPEVWAAFFLMAGFLPLEPVPWKPPRLVLGSKGLEMLLWAGVAFYGLCPPFRPASLALAACVLVGVAAFRRAETGPFHPWIAGAVVYFVGRSVWGGSTLGSAWFLTSAALAAVFYLWVRRQNDPGPSLLRFSRLGLAWAAFEWFHFLKDPQLHSIMFFAQPKHLASFLAILFLMEWTALKRSKWGVLSMSISALTMAAFKATGAWMGLVAGLSVLCATRRYKWDKVLLVIALAVLAFAGVWRFLPGHQSTPLGRLQMAKAAIVLGVEAPLAGLGPGTYGPAFHRAQEPQEGKATRYLMDPQRAHNEWLEAFESFGLLGLVFLGGWGWILWGKKSRPETRSLGLASCANALVDFIWHTPVLAWQGAASTVEKPRPPSKGGAALNGLMALALAVGIWPTAAWAPEARKQAGLDRQSGRYPEALRAYQSAERLAPWDYRHTLEKASYLEALYLETGDARWASRSDDAYDRLEEMEPEDGEMVRLRALRDGARAEKEMTPESFQKAVGSYERALGVLPYSAQVRREMGDFLQRGGWKEAAAWKYRDALDLEPNDASTWVAFAELEKSRGRKGDAREAFKTAWAVHERWKNEEVAPVEREMVTLDDDVLKRVRSEITQ